MTEEKSTEEKSNVDKFFDACLNLVLQYNAADWVVFPLRPIMTTKTGERVCGCGKKGCPGVGKHPGVKWKGLKEPVGSLEIKDWFWRSPAAGWAVVLGPSNLCVLDVDPRNGGLESFDAFERQHGKLPVTLKAATGGGGFHYYFQDTGNLPACSSILLAPGLELLSGSHITILPPSPHKSGKRYKWETPASVDEVPLPSFILDAARKIHEASKPPVVTRIVTPAALQSTFDSNSILTRARSFLAKIPPGIEGQNGTRPFVRAAHVLILGFNLSVPEAFPLLTEYSNRCLPPWPDEDIGRALNNADKKGDQRGYLLESHHREDAIDRELGCPDYSKLVIEVTLSRPAPAGGDGASERLQYTKTLTVEAQRAADIRSLDAFLATMPKMGELDPSIPAAAHAFTPTGTPDRRPTTQRCSHTVFCRHRTEAAARVIWVTCGRWCCDHCSLQLKKAWKDNIRQRITSASAVYMIACIAENWKNSLYRKIERAGGNYICIRQGAGYRIICDVPPTPGAKPLSKPESLRVALAAIDDLRATRKPISSSRDWKLPQAQRDNEWEKIGPTVKSPRVVREILEEHGLDVNETTPEKSSKIGKSMRFALPAHWREEHVLALQMDLEEGKAFSYSPELLAAVGASSRAAAGTAATTEDDFDPPPT